MPHPFAVPISRSVVCTLVALRPTDGYHPTPTPPCSACVTSCVHAPSSRSAIQGLRAQGCSLRVPENLCARTPFPVCTQGKMCAHPLIRSVHQGICVQKCRTHRTQISWCTDLTPRDGGGGVGHPTTQNFQNTPPPPLGRTQSTSLVRGLATHTPTSDCLGGPDTEARSETDLGCCVVEASQVQPIGVIPPPLFEGHEASVRCGRGGPAPCQRHKNTEQHHQQVAQ